MAKNWDPVIDDASCAECGACVAKCPHGGYDTAAAPSPVVKNSGRSLLLLWGQLLLTKNNNL
ncbi:MAG: 4Fe-4S binding protein [Oscillospiraceae bacterium]|nr:4Fe-4S binding protein [Oscillospiraceae bacterium]